MAEAKEVEEYLRRGEALRTSETQQRARMRGMKFDTRAVHGMYGLEALQQNNGSIIEPLFLSSAQAFENSAHLETALAYRIPAWTYSRYANPTVYYLEETLALLEGYGFDGELTACAKASSMAAIVMATQPFLSLEGGAAGKAMNFVTSAQIYGGAFTLFSRRYGEERGVEVRWVRNPLDLDEWASRIDPETRFVYAEMPSNPTLAVCDIPALTGLACQHGIPLIVDSTVATPALLRPIQLGADIVVHSLSKSIGISGFSIAGALLARRGLSSRVGPEELRQDFALHVKRLPFRDFGPGLSPFNALMLLNDLRWLRVRMDSLSRSAAKIAEFLQAHPQVEQVYYPGLATFPGHALARRLMWLADGEGEYGRPVNRYGHLLSFTVNGGAERAKRTLDRLQLILRAADLGRIKSLATIPAISTHQQQGEAGRSLGGVPPHLIRLNVGGEHVDDLIADLDQALR